MQPTIPLELQLQIFELAIPPLMRRNLPHLRELMKTWPLVSRAWKAWAYAKVPVVPKLVLENAKTDQATFDRFLAAVADSGRVVKRFEVDLAGWDEQSISIDRLRDFLGHAETLWLAPPEDEYEWVFDLADLCRLCLYDTCRDTRAALQSAPPVLTHLALEDILLGPLEVSFPHVDTLVLKSIAVPDNPTDFLPRWPALRILAICGSAIGDEQMLLDYSAAFPTTLQHLLLSDSVEQHISVPPVSVLHFPSSLKSITSRFSSGAPYRRSASDLRRPACAGTDTEFIEVVYNRDDPLEADFDVEEWALSVGA